MYYSKKHRNDEWIKCIYLTLDNAKKNIFLNYRYFYKVSDFIDDIKLLCYYLNDDELKRFSSCLKKNYIIDDVERHRSELDKFEKFIVIHVLFMNV